MIQKVFFNHSKVFLLSLIFFNFIVGCNPDSESGIILVESGIYSDCQTLKSNKSIRINREEKSAGTYSVCSNSLVNIYNPKSERFEDKLIIFNSSFIGKDKIYDATSLWYNRPTVVKEDDSIYIGYVTSKGEVSVTRYNIKDKKWDESLVLWHFNVGDDHSAPAIQVNESGDLIALFSYHSTALYRAVVNTNSELSLNDVSVIDSGYTTYPMMYKFSDGNLISFYRKGFSGENSKGEYHSISGSDGGLTWSDSKPLIKFNQRYITYAIVKQIGGALYVAYTSLDREDGTHNNVYISYSRDFGKTWYSKDGYSSYLTDDNSVKVVSGKQIRVHDIGVYNNSMAVSYSIYVQEYDCCSKENDLFVYLEYFDKSFFVGNGLINYYSDGLVFENNLGQFGYYISPSDIDSTSVINMVEFNVDDKSFNNIGKIEVSSNIMRLNSLSELGVGSLSWIEYDYYNGYNDFKTNISVGGG